MALLPSGAYAKSIQLKNAGAAKTMAVGSVFQIKTNQKASKLAYTTSKKSVADISKAGMIRAKKKGTATIQIKSGKTVKKMKLTVAKPTGYTISKTSGSYTSSVRTSIKAKKGYAVYYATGSKFTKQNVIRAGKTKEFEFTENKVLKLYPVKASEKMSAKKLKGVKDTAKGRADYQYTITASSEDPSIDGTATPQPDVSTAPAPTQGSPESAKPTDTTPTGMPLQSPPNGATDAPNGDQQTSAPSETAPGDNTVPGQSANPGESTAPGESAVPGESTNPGENASPAPVTTPGQSTDTGDDSASDYVEPAMPQYDDTDRLTSAKDGEQEVSIEIPKEAPSKKIETDTYTISKKNKLTIIAPGTYRICTAGTDAVDGLIEVDCSDESSDAVHLIFDGVNLTSSTNTAPDSDTGLVTVKKSVARAVITLAEGSVNTLLDTGATGIDKDDATSVTYTGGIVCKKTPLTINGKGKLDISTVNGNGIKATDTLKIVDATICVNGAGGTGDGSTPAGHNGISGKTGLFVKDAVLDVHSVGDAVKTTLDEKDVSQDATLSGLGNMTLDGGTYTLVSTDGDGVSAFRTLYLSPKEMSVTTMNAADSKESGSYKGVKAGVTICVPKDAGTIRIDTSATYHSTNAGWDSNDSYADDAFHCDGYIRIDGGVIEISAGDDAIHSDKGLTINGGAITISDCYEGLESGDITINGGTISLVSRDDGINVGGGNDAVSNPGNPFPGNGWFKDDDFGKGDSASTANYQVIINGGVLTIDAEGDGIDSNGNIFIRGGEVTVNGPTASMNGALDYDDRNCVCEISGGTLIAAGAVGMDVAPTNGSTQPAVNVRFSASQAANTYVVIKDSDGNTVLTAQPTKKFQSVVMSTGSMMLGNTYTVWYGSSLDSLVKDTEFTFTSVSVPTGSGSSGIGGGWRPGRR